MVWTGNRRAAWRKGDVVAYKKATEQVECEQLGRNFKLVGKQSNRMEESWTRHHFEV